MKPGALSMETLQGMASLILTVKTPLEGEHLPYEPLAEE
jgi:hypothetical protein